MICKAQVYYEIHTRTAADNIAVFRPYGRVHIKWVDDTNATVTLDDASKADLGKISWPIASLPACSNLLIKYAVLQELVQTPQTNFVLQPAEEALRKRKLDQEQRDTAKAARPETPTAAAGQQGGDAGQAATGTAADSTTGAAAME